MIDPIVDVACSTEADGGDLLTFTHASGRTTGVEISDGYARECRRNIQDVKRAVQAARAGGRMTPQEYRDIRKELTSAFLRNTLVEGAKERLKFERDRASYEGVHVKAANIMLDVLGSVEVVKAICEACLKELNRRAANEADGHEEQAAQLREAIEG